MPQKPARRCAGPLPLSSSPFGPFSATAAEFAWGPSLACSALELPDPCRKELSLRRPTMYCHISTSRA